MESPRFSIHAAAQEWGCHRETLGKKLKELGFEEHPQGGWSIAQIDKALHGDVEEQLKVAQTRKANEEADAKALDNARERGEVIDMDDLSKRLETKALSAKQTIENMDDLSNAQKDAVLKAMSDLFKS